MTTEEMAEELAQYYEAAGFVDFYEREIRGKSDDEIARMYAAHCQSLMRGGDGSTGEA